MQPPQKPCSVPSDLCLDDLFACMTSNNCGCVTPGSTPMFEAGKVAEFCELNTDLGAPVVYPEGCSTEQRAYMAEWWKHLTDAYVSLYERTCRRFHGCCLALSLCFNTGCKCSCDCSCDPCAETECYQARDLTECMDGAIRAEMVTYTTAGETVDAVNVPGVRPDPTARWRIADNGRICRLATGGTYPAFPPQNMTLPVGAAGTSVLKVYYCDDLDPDFVAAVYELAQQFGKGCSEGTKCSIPSNASSITDDGVTINLANQSGTPTTSTALRWRQLGFTGNETIDRALIRWQCIEEAGGVTFGFPRGSGDVTVRDRFWCPCD